MKREELLSAVKKVESEGLIAPEQSERVGARLAEILIPHRDHAKTAASVIAWLGGILVAAGLLLLIASNWDQLGKIPKLVLVFGTLGGLHWAGYRFAENPGHRPALGQALTGAAMLAFGGAIALVAQIYNLSAEYPNAILVWWTLSVPFVLLMRSRKLLLVPLALFVLWAHMHADAWFDDLRATGRLSGWEREALMFSCMEIGLGALLAAIAALCRKSSWSNFAAPLALLGRFAAFGGLFVLAFEDFGSSHLDTGDSVRLFSTERLREIGLVLAPALFLGGAAVATCVLALARRGVGEAARHELHDVAGAVAAAGLIAGTMVVLPGAAFLVANVAILAAVIALVLRGVHQQRPADVNLAVIVFLVTAMARYFEYVAQGFGGFFAFLGAGVLLLALGTFLERKRRGWVARAVGSAA